MKKSIKVVAIISVLIMILLTLTGCMNVNFDVKLEKDGSGDVSYVIGYKKSFIESMGMSVDDIKQNDTSLEEKQKAGEEEGYTVEEYEDENVYGIVAKKHYDNIQDFSINRELELEVEEGADKITFEKSGSKIKYSQDMKLNLKDMLGALDDESADEEEQSETAMMNAMLKQMEMTYKITLPFKAGENNATTVSNGGKTLEWKLNPGEENEIKFVAEQNGGNLILICACVVAIVVIVVVVMLLISKKSKKTSENVEVKDEQKEE